MTFSFSKNSLARFEGVDPRLVAVAHKALSYGVLDFAAAQGVRTDEEQEELYAQGRTKPGKIVTWTLDSKHKKQADGYGHALDLVPVINGKIDWNDIQAFHMLATLMFRAAMELGHEIEWGGHWMKNKDYPHFQVKEHLS